MEKYNNKLVEEVRQGKAQIQCDQDDKYNDLLNYIFPKRTFGVVLRNFYKEGKVLHNGFYTSDQAFEDLPIIHASKFIEEPRWVEVSDDNYNWQKGILVSDLGERFFPRCVAVDLLSQNEFLNGEDGIKTQFWHYMREIEEPKESDINKVLNEILKEYQDNEFEGIVKIIKSKMI